MRNAWMGVRRIPKSSSALLLNGVSGLGPVFRLERANPLGETPLRTLAAPGCGGTTRIASVLSCVSVKTRGFKLAPGGFCSLEEKLHSWLR